MSNPATARPLSQQRRVNHTVQRIGPACTLPGRQAMLDKFEKQVDPERDAVYFLDDLLADARHNQRLAELDRLVGL